MTAQEYRDEALLMLKALFEEPCGKLAEAVKVLVLELIEDRRKTRRRAREGLARWRNRTRRLPGNCPYGYRKTPDGTALQVEPSEQAIIETIQRLRAKHYTTRAIATDLNAQGLRTRSGSRWRHEYISRILRTHYVRQAQAS